MVNYRLANKEDNQQLLELTSSTAMSGKMALRIDRYPNFFDLIKLRGKSKVFVATENNKIVGSICVSLEQVYVNKDIVPLYYISDFKVAQTHRGRGVGLQLTNEVVKYLETENADFAFLNVSKGNKRPFIFFSDRSHYPDFENIGIFKILQFIGSNTTRINTKFNIELSPVNDDVIDFLNQYYSKHELANVITKEKLKESEIYIVRQNNDIVAAMCLIDTMNMKQNIVLKSPRLIRYFIRFTNHFSKVLNISKMPAENEPIKMLYIKYLAVNNNNKDIVKALIKKAKNEAYIKKYSFVSLGLHENDPLIKALPGLFKLTFYSVGMLVSMKNSKGLMNQVKKGVPFKDYSIV